MSQHDKLLSQLMNTGREPRDEAAAAGRKGPALDFNEDAAAAAAAAQSQGAQNIEMFRGENLKRMAIQNLKDRRQRQKQSEIFNQQETMRRKEEEAEKGAVEEEASLSTLERIDLTKTQMAAEQDGGDQQQIDEFDLLEAKIDPKDIRTLEKVNRLQEEIEFEKTKIKCKFIFKYSFQTNDPMKIAE